MKYLAKKNIELIALISVTTATSFDLEAAPSLLADAGFGYYNESEGFAAVLDFEQSGGAFVAISGAAHDDFYQFYGNASASAAIKKLRAQGGGSVDGNLIDEGFYVEEAPDFYTADGIASFSETLAYGGTAVNYNSRYILGFSGTITGNAFVVITLKHANNPSDMWIFDTPGIYNEVLVSDAYVHGGSPQLFSLTLQSSVNLNPDNIVPDSGNADFGSTLEVLGIDLRDNDTGELLTAETVSGESGSRYEVIPVPEPAAFFLFGLGGLFGCLRRSRR